MQINSIRALVLYELSYLDDARSLWLWSHAPFEIISFKACLHIMILWDSRSVGGSSYLIPIRSIHPSNPYTKKSLTACTTASQYVIASQWAKMISNARATQTRERKAQKGGVLLLMLHVMPLNYSFTNQWQLYWNFLPFFSDSIVNIPFYSFDLEVQQVWFCDCLQF